MKKNLFGVFAIALAFCLSAYTSNTMGSRNAAAGKVQPSLFWYNINANGSLGTALSGAQMTKSTALGFTPCQDIISTDCVRGYSSTQVVGTNPAPPTNASVDYHIRKNQ